MMQEVNQNQQKITINRIKLSGTVKEVLPAFESRGTKYNRLILAVNRLSGAVDEIPVVFKESASWMAQIGSRVDVEGSIRTRNVESDGKNKLEISVFGFISIPEVLQEGEEVKDANEVELEGFICKQPNLRETPFKRQISDILVAVNTKPGKSHYIPLVAFFNEARQASKYNVGDRILIKGRFQSRKYNKKVAEDKVEERTAYEVVISSLQREGEEVSDVNNN